MSDTIRDVLIKVSVENGKMKLDAPDMSAWQSAIADLRKEMQSLGTGLSGGSGSVMNGVSAVKSAFVDVQDSVKTANTEVEQLKSNLSGLGSKGQTGPVRIGMPGYGASVDNRASAQASQAMAQMQQAGMLSGYSDADRETLHGQLTKRSARYIKESDREGEKEKREADKKVAESARESARAAREQEQAAQKSSQAVVGLGRGLAHLSTASGTLSGDLAKLVVVTEGMATVGNAAIAGLGTLTGGLAGLAVAGVAAAAYVVNRNRQFNRASEQRDIEMQQATITLSQGFFHEQGQLHYRRSSGMHGANTVELMHDEATRKSISIGRQDKIYDDRFENHQGTTGQARELMRRDGLIEGSRISINKHGAHIESLNEKRVLLANPLSSKEVYTNQVKEQHRKLREVIQTKKDNIVKDPAYLVKHSKEQKFEINDLDLQIEKSKLDEAKELKQLNDDIVDSKQKLLQIDDEIAQRMLEQHKTATEMKQDAKEAVRAEQEKIRAGNQQYGSQNEGEKLQERELQKKYMRNKEKRAANLAAGRDADEGIEHYEQYEIQAAHRTRNIALMDVQKQTEKEGVRDGIQKIDANQDTLNEANDYKNKVNEKFGEGVTLNEDNLSDNSKKAADSLDVIGKHLEGILEVQKNIQLVRDRVEELEINNQAYKNARR